MVGSKREALIDGWTNRIRYRTTVQFSSYKPHHRPRNEPYFPEQSKCWREGRVIWIMLLLLALLFRAVSISMIPDLHVCLQG